MIVPSSIRRRRDKPTDTDGFPWTVPLIRDLDRLDFTAPVTFLVGENGSGKSTLLEGLAAGMDAVAAGSRDLARDPTLQAACDFASGSPASWVGRHPMRPMRPKPPIQARDRKGTLVQPRIGFFPRHSNRRPDGVVRVWALPRSAPVLVALLARVHHGEDEGPR